MLEKEAVRSVEGNGVDTIILAHTTGDKEIDEVIIAFIAIFEAAMPGYIQAYYLMGSRANRTEVVNSDLDLIVICKDKTEQKRVQLIADGCTRLSARELDISIKNTADLVKGVSPIVKVNRFLYGENVLERTPLISPQEWTRDRMYASYWLLISIFDRPKMVCWPIGYPDAQDEFYGYVNRTVLTADKEERSSTRNLIRVTGWMATARIALEAEQYVTNKYECYTMYRQWIGDEWVAFLESTYALCRGRWNYLVPDSSSERAHLRSICAQTLAWENHFLQVFKTFLLAELQDENNPEMERITWLMGEIPYYDSEIQAALQKRYDTAPSQLQQLIAKALLHFIDRA